MTPSAQLTKHQSDDALHISPAKFRTKLPSFTVVDEQYWFDNVDDIYARRKRPQHKFDSEKIGIACLIDFSTGRNFVNLRQALMTFDTLFVVPPIFENSEGWDNQGLSLKDIQDAIFSGRLKFVLTQNEERLDTSLLERAFESDPSSVIGRRRAASILLVH